VIPPDDVNWPPCPSYDRYAIRLKILGYEDILVSATVEVGQFMSVMHSCWDPAWDGRVPSQRLDRANAEISLYGIEYSGLTLMFFNSVVRIQDQFTPASNGTLKVDLSGPQAKWTLPGTDVAEVVRHEERHPDPDALRPMDYRHVVRVPVNSTHRVFELPIQVNSSWNYGLGLEVHLEGGEVVPGSRLDVFSPNGTSAWQYQAEHSTFSYSGAAALETVGTWTVRLDISTPTTRGANIAVEATFRYD
jgi:hypothetical protein